MWARLEPHSKTLAPLQANVEINLDRVIHILWMACWYSESLSQYCCNHDKILAGNIVTIMTKFWLP
jgi:hypothetical protein